MTPSLPFTQVWELHGNVNSWQEHPQTWLLGKRPAAHSLAFFCPTCGDIWAKVKFCPASPEAIVCSWQTIYRRCERHGDGSLWVEDRKILLTRLLLIRELNLLARELSPCHHSLDPRLSSPATPEPARPIVSEPWSTQESNPVCYSSTNLKQFLPT